MKPLNVYNAVAPQQAAREQEALAFRLTARTLREATDRTSRNRALRISHSVWSFMFRDLSSSGNRLPEPLRTDCLKVAHWAMHYSNKAVLTDLPLLPLIEVNETVAEGLEARPGSPDRAAFPAPVASMDRMSRALSA